MAKHSGGRQRGGNIFNKKTVTALLVLLAVLIFGLVLINKKEKFTQPMPPNIPTITYDYKAKQQQSGGICPGNCGGKNNSNCTACGVQDYCPNKGQICAIVGFDKNNKNIYKAFNNSAEVDAYIKAHPDPCGPSYVSGPNGICFYSG